jgi:hypothetical protein
VVSCWADRTNLCLWQQQRPVPLKRGAGRCCASSAGYRRRTVELGQETAHRRRPAVQVDAGEEELKSVEGDVVGDANVADMAAGRVARMACIIDSWVPTASMTECAETIGEFLDLRQCLAKFPRLRIQPLSVWPIRPILLLFRSMSSMSSLTGLMQAQGSPQGSGSGLPWPCSGVDGQEEEGC